MADPTVTEGADSTPMTRRPRRHRVRNGFVAVLAVLLAVVAFLFLKPAGATLPTAANDPATSFADATARIAAAQAAEAATGQIMEGCGTRLYDHGAATADVVVLLHGYTNCSKQYTRLAQELFDMSYTVYVPLVPDHGMLPENRTPLGSLTADEVIAYSDNAVDVAAGLGDRMTVMGLSGGGLVASYIAQYRPEADRVIPIAGFFGLPSVPEFATQALVNALAIVPPFDAREAPPDAAVRGAYPHGASDTSTRGANAYMQVGQTILASAANEAPAAGRIIVVINDNDDQINNGLVQTLADRWEAKAPDATEVYHFDKSLGLLHDVMTPDREGQKVDIVYPVLLELMTKP